MFAIDDVEFSGECFQFKCCGLHAPLVVLPGHGRLLWTMVDSVEPCMMLLFNHRPESLDSFLATVAGSLEGCMELLFGRQVHCAIGEKQPVHAHARVFVGK